jgi:predicted DsbA family dithiol-disulfide isomerase
MESEFISADMIEATEFPHLVQRYGVFGVPRTVINEDFSVEGAVPEEKLLSEITRAVKKDV